MKRMKEKSIKINFVFNTIKTIMVVVFPLISFPYVSRVLGVEGIGRFEYCSSVISYFILFASLGISTYSIREVAGVRDDKEKFSKFTQEIFTINMMTTLGAYLVLFLCFLAGAFQGRRTLMLVCSLSIAGTTLCIDWLYQAMEQYVYISVRTILLQAVSLILMFVFVRSEEDVLVYALIYVFSSKGYCFLNLYNARKYVDFRRGRNLELKKHLKPILVIFGATLSVSVYMHMDTVMLGIICGDYQVGLYSAAVKVNMVVKNVITSVGVVILPRLVSHLAYGEKDKYEKLFKQGADLNMFLSMASAVGLFVLSEPIIRLFSGEKFLAAVPTAKILAVRLVFSALDNIFYNQVLIPTGNEMKACIGTTAGAVANLVLNAILIPFYQTAGAAVATVLSEGVVFVYFIYATRNIINLRMVLNRAPRFVTASGVMGIVLVIALRYLESPVLKILILVPAGALVYIGVLGLFLLKDRFRKLQA